MDDFCGSWLSMAALAAKLLRGSDNQFVCNDKSE